MEAEAPSRIVVEHLESRCAMVSPPSSISGAAARGARYAGCCVGAITGSGVACGVRVTIGAMTTALEVADGGPHVMIYKCASSSGGTIAEANNRGASVVEYGATYGDADARGEVSWGA
jgi:hypothetical protein